MSVVIDGTLGITTPAETVQGALTTTGNTILGDATTDTLNVGAGGLVKDASGNVGIGTASPTVKLDIRDTTAVMQLKSSTGTNAVYATINNTGGDFYIGRENSTGGTFGTTAPYASVFYATGACPMAFFTNATERMRIDSSGNVGIGTSSPASYAKFSVIGGSIYTDAALYSNDGTTVSRVISSGGVSYWGTTTNQPVVYQTNNIERMRIDTSGNLLVGTTSGVPSGGFNIQPNGFGTGQSVMDIGHISGTPSGIAFERYIYNNTIIGSITQNGTTAVLYNTTSDYRLKTDATPIQNALTTIEALNPISFNWVDGRPDDGFLAHELQDVIPNCVTGEKDAVNEDGTPKYQQMDSSGVIPFLVKSIQELKAIVDAQAVRIAALEV
jgi:hypothetical protein